MIVDNGVGWFEFRLNRPRGSLADEAALLSIDALGCVMSANCEFKTAATTELCSQMIENAMSAWAFF